MTWLFFQVTSPGPNIWQRFNWEHRPEMQQARPVFHPEIVRVLGISNEGLRRQGTIG